MKPEVILDQITMKFLVIPSKGEHSIKARIGQKTDYDHFAGLINQAGTVWSLS